MSKLGLQIYPTPKLVAAIDAWRRMQPDIPSRAEAGRKLIEMGLATSKEDKGHGHQRNDARPEGCLGG